MKKFLILILLFSLTGCSIRPPFGASTKEWEKPGKEYLKLKITKDKILDVQEKDGVKTYLYISDVKVPAKDQIIDGQKTIEDITKRTKNALFFKKSKKLGAIGSANNEEWEAHFYSGNPFYKDNGNWYQTETATTTVDAYNDQTATTTAEIIKNWIFKTAIATDFYGLVGDGWSRSYSSGTWLTAHEQVNGNSVSLSDTQIFCAYRTSTGFYLIYRGYEPINTSALPDDANITGAILNVYIEGLYDSANDGNDWINIVQTTQASSTTLVVADYSKCGAVSNPTEGSTRKDLTSDFTIETYSNFSLNSTGLTWISKTGYTLLGLREGHDAINSACASGGFYDTGIVIYPASTPGTSKDPYLSVTYTTGGISTPAPLNQFITFE